MRALNSKGGHLNEYVIHAKVKNNLLLKRILESHKNVAQFCIEHNLSTTRVGDLINMREPAVTRHGAWTTVAQRLARIFGVSEEQLFTDEQSTARLDRNDVFIEVSKQEAELLVYDPTEAVERLDLVRKLMRRASLTDKERVMIEARFFHDKTLKDAGASLGVCGARAMQIEAKALRKLRGAVGKERLTFDQCLPG